jgi:hypothetical protein
MPDIDELFMEHLGPSLSKQRSLLQAVEGLPCDIDLDTGEATFGDRLTFPVQLLGFEEEESQTWIWSWALEEPLGPESLNEAALALKEYGEKHDLELFTVPSFGTEDLSGDEVAILSCGVSGAGSFFAAHTEEDEVTFFLIPDLRGQLPSEKPASFVAEVIEEMMDTYLRYEGYTLEEKSRRKWIASHPNGGRLALEFDNDGQLDTVDAS